LCAYTHPVALVVWLVFEMMPEDSQEVDDIRLSYEGRRKKKCYSVHCKLQAVKAAKETSIRAAAKRFDVDRNVFENG
jgi:hypothetical protein